MAAIDVRTDTVVVTEPHGFAAYAVSDQGLVMATFFHASAQAAKDILADIPVFVEPFRRVSGTPVRASLWRRAFQDFFRGGTTAIHPESVPLETRHWNPFRTAVYLALRDNVQWGETIAYGELAALAGFPGAARAVGSAMAKNTGGPFVPCHRVIAAGGRLGGYSGSGGIALKRLLLEHERTHPLSTSWDPGHPGDRLPGNLIP